MLVVTFKWLVSNLVLAKTMKAVTGRRFGSWNSAVCLRASFSCLAFCAGVSILTRFGFGFGLDVAFVFFAVFFLAVGFLAVDCSPLLVAAALGRPTEANPRKTWRHGVWILDLAVGWRATERADLAKAPETNRDVAERPMEKIMVGDCFMVANHHEIYRSLIESCIAEM